MQVQLDSYSLVQHRFLSFTVEAVTSGPQFPDLIKQVAALGKSFSTFENCYNGQFRQVTLLFSDLIRQVSLYDA